MLKADTEKELCGLTFIRIFINAVNKHTGRQQHGSRLAGFQTPATETVIMVGSWKRGNQGPYGRSGSLLLHLSQDGGGFTAHKPVARLCFSVGRLGMGWEKEMCSPMPDLK